MEFAILVIGILAFLAVLFHFITYIIRLWTGCDQAEAVAKLHNFVNGKTQASLNHDRDFVDQIWCDIRKIIGDKNFEQLERISTTSIKQGLLFFGEGSGLPYIVISTYYESDHMKRVLENVVTNIVKSYLKIYGYNENVLIEWRVRPDLDMPYMIIRYARNPEETRILEYRQNEVKQRIIARNKPIKDATEAVELDG